MTNIDALIRAKPYPSPLRYSKKKLRDSKKEVEAQKKIDKKLVNPKTSKSGKTVKTPAGTAVTTTKKGQKKTASAKRVKSAEKNVLKSVAKGLVKRAGAVGVAATVAEPFIEEIHEGAVKAARQRKTDRIWAARDLGIQSAKEIAAQRALKRNDGGMARKNRVF